MTTTSTPATTTDRAGDQDREKTASRLGQALALGYLPLDEYEERVQRVFQTPTIRELRDLLRDLPLDRIRRADPRRRAAKAAAARRGVNIHFIAYLAMATVIVIVWATVAATSGASYFWPIWPLLGGAVGLSSHAFSVPSFRHNA